MKAYASFVLASTLLLPAAGLGPRAAETARPPVEGTFIQYEQWMMKLDREAWRLELDAMREAGITLVIVQWLEFQNVRFIPADPSAPDPTDIILDYADEHGMRVFVGLHTEDRWHERFSVPRYLDRAAAMSLRLADLAWARYGDHASFAGWYIPQEPRFAEYGREHLDLLRGFYRRQSDRCREISGGKPVAISPALSAPRDRPEPERFRAVFAGLLSGAGVDMVLLQDGIGAHRGEYDFDAKVVPYFRAMRDACREAGVELWSDIEIFQRKRASRGSEPARIERIRRQIDAAAPFVEGFVMFDFFHYMSPRRGEAQKKLFEDYLREVVRSGPAPR